MSPGRKGPLRTSGSVRSHQSRQRRHRGGVVDGAGLARIGSVLRRVSINSVDDDGSKDGESIGDRDRVGRQSEDMTVRVGDGGTKWCGKSKKRRGIG
ncbi:hypothetical protein NL676_034274 [Syzygium grande]|nr:hypothetical protein NL676_034274 [Syzygium grande]